MSITITGATGKLGSLIISQLLQKVNAQQIVACVRNPEKAASIRALGVEVRQCDYDHPALLENAFADTAKLLFISSSHIDDTVRLRQHSHVIEAAKKAKVAQIIYTSFAFPEKSDISLTHLHLATEHAIRTTGIPYTFLRNALYSDFLAQIGLDEAMHTGELVTAPGKWRFNSVTRDDLALAAANVVTTNGHENQTYELTASQAWSFAELVKLLSTQAGKTITHREDALVDNWLYRFLGRIDTASTTTDLEGLIGRQTASLHDSVTQILADRRG